MVDHIKEIPVTGFVCFAKEFDFILKVMRSLSNFRKREGHDMITFAISKDVSIRDVENRPVMEADER